jgi:hypothetical protein
MDICAIYIPLRSLTPRVNLLHFTTKKFREKIEGRYGLGSGGCRDGTHQHFTRNSTSIIAQVIMVKSVPLHKVDAYPTL